VGQLEQHYLRNPAPGLFFALLTDYMDAPTENQPNDVDLVEKARQGIRSLNEKYLGAGPGSFSVRRFALLHRERRWNPSESVWMGWERKRGKLHELNCMILAARGVSLGGCSLDSGSSFPIREGDLSFLPRVRYVITLDATPPLATLPGIDRRSGPSLNRAISNPSVRAGAGGSCFGIYHSAAVRYPATQRRCIISRIFSGDTGLDLQGLCRRLSRPLRRGSYVGKGVYGRELRAQPEGCIPKMPCSATICWKAFMVGRPGDHHPNRGHAADLSVRPPAAVDA
jgi:cyclic beta-1,2-glucan synthetase